jgi:Clr5 domain
MSGLPVDAPDHGQAGGSSVEDLWNAHRETIRVLYLEQNKTLKDVQGIMAKPPYNLPVS